MKYVCAFIFTGLVLVSCVGIPSRQSDIRVFDLNSTRDINFVDNNYPNTEILVMKPMHIRQSLGTLWSPRTAAENIAVQHTRRMNGNAVFITEYQLEDHREWNSVTRSYLTNRYIHVWFIPIYLAK